jgi:hypothetical protein
VFVGELPCLANHALALMAFSMKVDFLKISRFLEHAGWEATNNGVERMGRTFRHLQRSRYNFRKLAPSRMRSKRGAHRPS